MKVKYSDYYAGDYDWNSRLSMPDDKLGNMSCAWTSDIVSADGAHYHFYFPFCKGEALENLKTEASRQARNHGDPVSFSYSFVM